jgi:hypothetical protein
LLLSLPNAGRLGWLRRRFGRLAGRCWPFLRYSYREGVLARDLSDTVQWPQVYRLSDVPRVDLVRGIPRRSRHA